MADLANQLRAIRPDPTRTGSPRRPDWLRGPRADGSQGAGSHPPEATYTRQSKRHVDGPTALNASG